MNNKNFRTSTPMDLYQHWENIIFSDYKNFIDEKIAKQNKKIVDIGGGFGDNDIRLAKLIGKHGKIINIEGDIQQAKLSKQNANKHGVLERMKTIHQYVSIEYPINYPDNYFDISYANRVLCITKEYKFVFSEMFRITKYGGSITTSCPDISSISVSSLNLLEESVFKLMIQNYFWKGTYQFIENPVQHFVEIGLSKVDITYHNIVDKNFQNGLILKYIESLKDLTISEFSFTFSLLQDFISLRLDQIINDYKSEYYYTYIGYFTISGTKYEVNLVNEVLVDIGINTSQDVFIL